VMDYPQRANSRCFIEFGRFTEHLPHTPFYF
jgi:hypothetical protein